MGREGASGAVYHDSCENRGAVGGVKAAAARRLGKTNSTHLQIQFAFQLAICGVQAHGQISRSGWVASDAVCGSLCDLGILGLGRVCVRVRFSEL